MPPAYLRRLIIVIGDAPTPLMGVLLGEQPSEPLAALADDAVGVAFGPVP